MLTVAKGKNHFENKWKISIIIGENLVKIKIIDRGFH